MDLGLCLQIVKLEDIGQGNKKSEASFFALGFSGSDIVGYSVLPESQLVELPSKGLFLDF